MKKLVLLLLAFLGFYASASNKQAQLAAKPVIRFRPLRKLFITGDFDGDRQQDTVRQQVFSTLTKKLLASAPDPFVTDQDSVFDWFYQQQAEVILTCNKSRTDTLFLGTGLGLFCLLNIGDNNADGKDELALVVDDCDNSQVNSCKVFTICQGKWTNVKQFGILEDAFDFTTATAPTFTEIKGFLTKQNGKWLYADYLKNTAKARPIGEHMTRLVVPKCK